MERYTTIRKGGEVIAAKIIVYAEDEEQYFSFITPEAYHELEKWMNYRDPASIRLLEFQDNLKTISLCIKIINKLALLLH
jgi:hypothetical protein